MEVSNVSTVRRVKPLFTKRRSRVCSGGSISIMVRRASVCSASISSKRIPSDDVNVSTSRLTAKQSS